MPATVAPSELNSLKAAPIITEMEAVITKTRGEILSGVSPAELEMLISLIGRLEQNIHDLQARDA